MSPMKDNLDFLSFPMYISRMSLFDVLPASEGAIVFVGDSLTQRTQWQEFFPDRTVINRGIDSDRSIGVLKRLDHIIALKPCKIFLMVGINDVYDKKDADHILNHYESILLRIKSDLPEAILYIQSLLPVNNSVFKHPVDNEDVMCVNAKLTELAKKYSTRFIDLYSYFLQQNELDDKYTLDGCHLSGQGYLAWVEVIKPFVNE
ncbi:GDSL-type esterase/lipase family protein [Paenibacillus silviterrae]|uniref:GDSL-type esterase/lipase family protein n=1 Tax=Paenibacillus silviterrae TaxID=3242194 RepID=UPI002542AA60|nr:GDSL-type esterase/lipase family protein [Paenibacillus chinjuensis]